MPTVDIKSPPLPIEKKRVLVRKITDVMQEVYADFGFVNDMFVVRIKENPPENVGVNGVLVADKQKK